MDNPGYVALTRQAGLLREMQAIAHNIANAATTGYRAEGLVFSEFVRRLGQDEPSLSMAAAHARQTRLTQGGLSFTGGQLDLAIEGPGFFRLETAAGERLTRAGHFALNAAGELVNPDGFRLLDDGGAPIQVPPGTTLALARDGTLSADGAPVARIEPVVPDETARLSREGGVLHAAAGGTRPAEGAVLHQGFLEDSNVDPIAQMARMVEVQRAYEAGQKFLDREDERIRAVIQTLSR